MTSGSSTGAGCVVDNKCSHHTTPHLPSFTLPVNLPVMQVQEQETEELGSRGVSGEEVAARQAELAKMRALMFYEQMKRHRANKIKSESRPGAGRGLAAMLGWSFIVLWSKNEVVS
jgi:hypothetical protein